MKSQHALNFIFGIYIFIFLSYLFGPLIIMSITAFNSAEFPAITPWECFSWRWFQEGKIAYDGQHLAGLSTDWRLHDGLIKSLIIGITAQVQRGLFAYVQVLVKEDGGTITVTSKGMNMDSLGEKIQDGTNVWNSDASSRCNTDSDTYWDEDGSTSDKLEVQHLEFDDDILISFTSGVGAVCFSKDGTWYGASGNFVSETGGDTSVDSVFFICGRTSEISKCDVSETEGVPNIEHDNLFWATQRYF